MLLSFDIVAHTGFSIQHWGNVVVYQYLFWFYSHPAVYIMVLPAFGLVSEILPVHARKPLFGYVTMVYSIMVIVVLGLVVWAHTCSRAAHHHGCASSSQSLPPSSPFRRESNSSTGWQHFGGKDQPNSAMLFSCGFIVNFVLGGITGVALAQVPFDITSTTPTSSLLISTTSSL